MKKISEHLGQIIAGLAAVCLLVTSITLFKAPVGDFFNRIVGKELKVSYETLDTIIPPDTDELQARYEFSYYSSLAAAVTDVNNGTAGENADADQSTAVAGTYTSKGKNYVVLLKDTTEPTKVKPSVDMTINLGGFNLSTSAAVVLDIVGGNVTIDGRLDGSTVSAPSDAYAIQVQFDSNVVINGGSYISSDACVVVWDNANVVINGGSYTCEGDTDVHGIAAYMSSKLTVSNCDITVTTHSSTAAAYGVFTSNHGVPYNCEAVLSNCNVVATSPAQAYGVLNSSRGTTRILNCNVEAYSNYKYNAEDSSYVNSACGIRSEAQSNTIIENCHVKSVHSAVSAYGALYVNGGTYESYGHGGFYLSGTNKTIYIENATSRECGFPEGYVNNGTTNGAGLYIGGGVGKDNITVYVNNCNIFGAKQPIVLRGTSGERNNTLYISNSRINLDYTHTGVRIDSDTHKLYIGAGCNFTADNTNRSGVVETTSETYTQE